MHWLKETLELLAPGWVGSIIGLVGIVTAGVTYVLTRQRTRLAYRYVGERLLGLSTDGLPTDITVQYRGQEIQRLTRTFVVFWNAGEKTILAADIVEADPLRLKLRDNGSVLAATVLKVGRTVCQVEAKLIPSSSNEVSLGFAFLDSGDGAVIEILHTSEKRHPEFLGTIRGLPSGLHNLGRITDRAFNRRIIQLPRPLLRPLRKLGLITAVLGVAIAGAARLVPWESLSKSSTEAQPTSLVFIGAGALYLLMGAVLIFLTRRRYPNALHVDELD